MNLAELLKRVEPSQLRQLGKLFQLEDDLPLIALVEPSGARIAFLSD